GRGPGPDLVRAHPGHGVAEEVPMGGEGVEQVPVLARQDGGGAGGGGHGGSPSVVGEVTVRSIAARFCPQCARISSTWEPPGAPWSCCRCCSEPGTGRAPSWLPGWRCRSERC